jgi:hypothetical protein
MAYNNSYSSASGLKSSLNGSSLPTLNSCSSCPIYNPLARTNVENTDSSMNHFSFMNELPFIIWGEPLRDHPNWPTNQPTVHVLVCSIRCHGNVCLLKHCLAMVYSALCKCVLILWQRTRLASRLFMLHFNILNFHKYLWMLWFLFKFVLYRSDQCRQIFILVHSYGKTYFIL